MGHYASEMGFGLPSDTEAQIAGFMGGRYPDSAKCPRCGADCGYSHEQYWKIHRDWHIDNNDWFLHS